jgi:hypothetical protein
VRSIDYKEGYDFDEDKEGELLIRRNLCRLTCLFTRLDPGTLFHEI